MPPPPPPSPCFPPPDEEGGSRRRRAEAERRADRPWPLSSVHPLLAALSEEVDEGGGAAASGSPSSSCSCSCSFLLLLSLSFCSDANASYFPSSQHAESAASRVTSTFPAIRSAACADTDRCSISQRRAAGSGALKNDSPPSPDPPSRNSNDDDGKTAAPRSRGVKSCEDAKAIVQSAGAVSQRHVFFFFFFFSRKGE